MSPYTFGSDDGEIPVGQCEAEIIEAKDGGYSRNGNPQLILELENAAGQQLSDWLTMTPRAKWRAQQVWSAAGLEWPADGVIDEAQLVGRKVHLEVIDDTYEGVTRRKIKEYSSPIGSDIGTPDLGFDPATGEVTVPATAAKADDDDIPF